MFRGQMGQDVVVNVAHESGNTAAYIAFYVGVFNELMGDRDAAAGYLKKYEDPSPAACTYCISLK